MNKNNLGLKIAKLRKSKNLSQSELARKLYISNKTISKWECGNGLPDINMLSKMSVVFGVSLDEILNLTEKDGRINEKDVSEREDSERLSKRRLLLGAIIPVTILLIIGVFLLCYFFIPRSPIIESTGLFKVNQTDTTIYCAVDNGTSEISLKNQFKVPLTNKWGVFYDLNGTNEIDSKAVDLQVGDNIFYLIVENSTGAKKTYTLTIRRKPIYVVSFDTNGGNSIVNQIVMEGELANLVTPEREGYIFNSWDYDFTQPITKNITIRASWAAKMFTLTLDENGGEVLSFDTVSVTYDSTYFLPITTRNGYDFVGWYMNENGVSIKLTDRQGVSIKPWNIAEDITAYAEWVEVVYLISYIPEENVIAEVDSSYKKESGEMMELGSYQFTYGATQADTSVKKKDIICDDLNSYAIFSFRFKNIATEANPQCRCLTINIFNNIEVENCSMYIRFSENAIDENNITAASIIDLPIVDEQNAPLGKIGYNETRYMYIVIKKSSNDSVTVKTKDGTNTLLSFTLTCSDL